MHKNTNSLGRALKSTNKYQHITPNLHSFDWLQVEQRIQCKICLIIHKALWWGLRFNQMIHLMFLLTYCASKCYTWSMVTSTLQLYQPSQHIWYLVQSFEMCFCALGFFSSPLLFKFVWACLPSAAQPSDFPTN